MSKAYVTKNSHFRKICRLRLDPFIKAPLKVPFKAHFSEMNLIFKKGSLNETFEMNDFSIFNKGAYIKRGTLKGAFVNGFNSIRDNSACSLRDHS